MFSNKQKNKKNKNKNKTKRKKKEKEKKRIKNDLLIKENSWFTHQSQIVIYPSKENREFTIHGTTLILNIGVKVMYDILAWFAMCVNVCGYFIVR